LLASTKYGLHGRGFAAQLPNTNYWKNRISYITKNYLQLASSYLREMDLDPPNNIRHCAHCLQSIPAENVKLCGGCRRRAFCSKECQVTDWSPSKPGQGHKNWCKLECGEEDLDWKVSEVAGKGLGLIALRKIPAKFRIIVDAESSLDHPGFKELMPLDGSAHEKFHLNCLGSDDLSKSLLCLRIARANHECDANASHYYDETHRVKILFAERDIPVGEEICINYQSCTDFSKNQTPLSARCILQLKWGIVCNDDCFCQNVDLEKMVQKGRKLDGQIFSLASSRNSIGALRAVRELLEIHTSIHSSWISKMRTNYDGFQVAIMQKRTLRQADEFIRQAYEIKAAITSPNSEEALKFKMFMNNPSTHNNYLILA